jgi:hypothetical protein
MTNAHTLLTLFGAAVFLPLFPLSTLYTLLMMKLPGPWLRVGVTLVWPQIGLALIGSAGVPADLPALRGMLYWALASALFYAWRLLATRELFYWSSFYAVSAWSLGWVGLVAGANVADIRIALGCFSLAAVLLLAAGHALARGWGDAYLGLRGGLARSLPRTGGIALIALLGVVAVPGFPTFFAMLLWLAQPGAGWAGMLGVLGVWFLWGWAAVEVWRGLAFGDAGGTLTSRLRKPRDLFASSVGLATAAVLAGGALSLFWSLTWWMK